MTNRFERLCQQRGLRLNGQRRIILRVLDEAKDHPSAQEVYERALLLDHGISVATVYRTLRILADAGVLVRIDFGDGRMRYEEARPGRHEHLVDVCTGRVLEFRHDGIAATLRHVAARLGYQLVDYRLELFGTSSSPTPQDTTYAFTPSKPRSYYRRRQRA